MGRQAPVVRVGHLLLEFRRRLAIAGVWETDDGFAYPVRQSELGDALGLSSVHVSRVMTELRTERLISYRPGTLRVLDSDRLAELCGFNSAYFSLESTAAFSLLA